MNTSTVNISFKSDLLEQIDQLAQEESRTRSELIREAARMYLEKKKKWQNIFVFGAKQVSKMGLTEDDIQDEIAKYREEKKKQTN